MPDFAPPMGGPDTVNLISMVFARDSTSRLSRPARIRVPPPAAPPRSELITTHPSASVSASFHSNTISGFLVSNFSRSSFIDQGSQILKANHNAGRSIANRTGHTSKAIHLVPHPEYTQECEYPRFFAFHYIIVRDNH